jgi:hypothetical protein
MLVVRRLDPDFTDLPRAWYAGDLALTHFANGLMLVFPDGERFFIRSVRHYEGQLSEPLKSQVRSFYAQEGHHGLAHEQQFHVLEAQGLEIQSWLAWYRNLAFRVIEPRTPPLLRLATTAALEHFTASFAAMALERRFLDQGHPGVRDLLLWHAAEEIEHRAVAFDVFVAAGGTWLWRVAGLVVATSVFLFFWRSAARHLIRQEPGLSRADVRASIQRRRRSGHDLNALLRRAFLAYLRPDFHPSHAQDDTLANDYLLSIGRAHG